MSTHALLCKAVKAMPNDYSDYGGTIVRWESAEDIHADCSSGCKHFVALNGTLGFDWGICANENYERFGLLTFEHQAGAKCYEAGDDA